MSMLWDCDVVCEQSLTGSSELPLFPCFLACCIISCGVSARLFKLFDCRTFLCSLMFFCLSSLSKMLPLLDAILFSRFSKSSVFVADFFFETRLSSAVFASSSLLFSFALSWSYEKLYSYSPCDYVMAFSVNWCYNSLNMVVLLWMSLTFLSPRIGVELDRVGANFFLGIYDKSLPGFSSMHAHTFPPIIFLFLI